MIDQGIKARIIMKWNLRYFTFFFRPSFCVKSFFSKNLNIYWLCCRTVFLLRINTSNKSKLKKMPKVIQNRWQFQDAFTFSYLKLNDAIITKNLYSYIRNRIKFRKIVLLYLCVSIRILLTCQYESLYWKKEKKS